MIGPAKLKEKKMRDIKKSNKRMTGRWEEPVALMRELNRSSSDSQDLLSPSPALEWESWQRRSGFARYRSWGNLEGERAQALGRVGGKNRRYPAGARAPCDVSAGVSVGWPQGKFRAELRDGSGGCSIAATCDAMGDRGRTESGSVDSPIVGHFKNYM